MDRHKSYSPQGEKNIVNDDIGQSDLSGSLIRTIGDDFMIITVILT